MKKVTLILGMSAIALVACNNVKTDNAGRDITSTDTSTQVNKLDTPMKADGTVLNDASGVPGTYEGTLPCADCEGIKTEITLNADNTYSITEEYLGKPGKFNEKGKWAWTKANEVMELQADGSKDKRAYRATKNRLTLMGGDGKIPAGDMASHYILKKK